MGQSKHSAKLYKQPKKQPRTEMRPEEEGSGRKYLFENCSQCPFGSDDIERVNQGRVADSCHLDKYIGRSEHAFLQNLAPLHTKKKLVKHEEEKLMAKQHDLAFGVSLFHATNSSETTIRVKEVNNSRKEQHESELE
jgi:hypothetical protein